LKIFLIGGKPEAVVGAAHYAREVLHQQVVGTCDGYGEMRDTINLVEVINRSGAELVMVALGNPIQEEWILSNLGTLEANVIMGVGALFDFWSGDKPRAPGFMRRLRLEWLFRLCIEPRRLMARYTVDFLHFLFLCRKFR
jgi:beta-1,4-glucosyltransferase